MRADPGTDCGDPPEETIRYNFDASWKREIDSFVDIINSGNAKVSSSSQDALATMKLVFAIYYADAEWCTKFGSANPHVLDN